MTCPGWGSVILRPNRYRDSTACRYNKLCVAESTPPSKQPASVFSTEEALAFFAGKELIAYVPLFPLEV
jgi:hypothetical protein